MIDDKMFILEPCDIDQHSAFLSVRDDFKMHKAHEYMRSISSQELPQDWIENAARAGGAVESYLVLYKLKNFEDVILLGDFAFFVPLSRGRHVPLKELRYEGQNQNLLYENTSHSLKNKIYPNALQVKDKVVENPHDLEIYSKTYSTDNGYVVSGTKAGGIYGSTLNFEICVGIDDKSRSLTVDKLCLWGGRPECDSYEDGIISMKKRCNLEISRDKTGGYSINSWAFL